MTVGAKTIAAFFALIALAGGHVRGDITPQPVASVAVIGDSYAAGFGAKASHAWQHYTALELGWTLATVRSHPGAGYVNPGVGGPYEAALAAQPLPSWVTQVVVQGGFNDIAHQPVDVAAAVSRTLALIRTQAPLATITVIGTFDPGPGVFAAEYPNLRGNQPLVRQAVEAAGARYVDGSQIRYELSADRVHPTPTGQLEIGYAIAAAIRQAAPDEVGRTTGRVDSSAAAVIGVSRVGLYGARYFYLASTQGGRIGRVTEVAFGDAADVPTLMPNAAGDCVPAVYRPSTGTLYAASTAVDGGGQVEAIPFGNPGDQLVQNAPRATPAGRTVFIHRPSQATFFERVPSADGAPDVGALVFGDRGDRGLVFSAAGHGTTLAVHRPTNSTFYLADPGSSSVAPVTSVPFGDPGDQGLVGAWGWSDTDGSDRLGVFRPATAQWFLANTPTPLTGGPGLPITSVTTFHFGNPGDTALACDPA
ncbi:SGNH/GDSL hydrolase family protein [Geodermatophilus sabuli]|uniref:Lysophospholipase L1 n=1 Tax=Geodermatophilus sabuli TaxID=1564158 RepID=A0A285EHJ9_9ACTN|nr:SGNH/GDSL hydrolase family protein [Geodermatophilus sabuli]MBB3086127.1 lysophospholipase L1-like esterase [Geodermatophilus sabuli]SNX98467.1 Lysophospholipase L1 [Geodermatophilus sabuli]